MSFDDVIAARTGRDRAASNPSKTATEQRRGTLSGPFSMDFDTEHVELDEKSLEYILGILVVLSNVLN